MCPSASIGMLASHLRPDAGGRMRAFWEGAAQGELRLPRCETCGTFAWPPRGHCTRCGSQAIAWAASSGRGTVHTFSVVRQTPDTAFAHRVPYVVAMIELDEGVRLLSNVVDCDVDRVRIGVRVAVTFVDAGDGLVLPAFVPTESDR